MDSVIVKTDASNHILWLPKDVCMNILCCTGVFNLLKPTVYVMHQQV